jgi:hypothetical protein
MSSKDNQLLDTPASSNKTDESNDARIAEQADGIRSAVTMPSNTVTNNCINQCEVKFLRWGVDSLYLSYQGNLTPEVDTKLLELKKLAQSNDPELRCLAQLKIGEHLFEVKDKAGGVFFYVLEDNAFRIQLSRPNKAVPMAYVKLSSEYLTHLSPEDAEKKLYDILSHLGILESSANVSRIDLFVDFVSHQNMEAWSRDAWVTRATSINAYSIQQRFTGWAIGLGGVLVARLYDKFYEIFSSNKGYLIPLWENAGWKAGEPIWRLEFQFEREVLVQKDVVKLRDTLSNLNGLWSYATTEWLKLCCPNPDDKTRSRWPIHPLWLALSNVDWETSGGVLKSRFSNERIPNDQAALLRAFSSLTTWMAIHKFRDFDAAIYPFCSALESAINNRAMDLGLGFEAFVNEKVSAKARLFNTLQNVQPIAQNDQPSAQDYRKASDGA